MVRFINCALIGALMASGTCVKAYEKKPVVNSLTATGVIGKSIAAYKTLKIYLDSGKVITSFTHTGISGKTAKYFKTAYKTGGGFNFDYYELGKSNSLSTVNRTKGVVKTWWGTFNKTEKPADLKTALGTFTGISGGTSFVIPNLLLSADFKKNNLFSSLTDPVIIGTELVDKVECYKISASSKHYSKFVIWIGKNDFLIRKLDTEIKIDRDLIQVSVGKIDSSVRAQHLRAHDTVSLKKDSVRQAKQMKMQAFSDSIMAMAGLSMKSFTSKETYFFFPYTLKKQNPELFKFRPNREIAL